MKNKLSIVQEENLCKLVRQYPVVFDKSQKGYKEKDVEENAWQEVAFALNFLLTGKSCQTPFQSETFLKVIVFFVVVVFFA